MAININYKHQILSTKFQAPNYKHYLSLIQAPLFCAMYDPN